MTGDNYQKGEAVREIIDSAGEIYATVKSTNKTGKKSKRTNKK